MYAETSRCVLVAGLGLLMAATGCGRGKGGPAGPPPVSVKLGLAVKTDTPIVVATFGMTEDRASVDIVPQVSGVLLQALVADGAVVTNGQPLFQIDPRDYAARVRQLQGLVAAGQANLQLSRDTVQRNAGLLEKALIAPEQFDALKARAAAAEAQAAADEAALEGARLNLERCTIAAPLAGICSKRLVDDGNVVAAGMSRLINIRSYDPLDVEFSLPEQYLGALRRALAAGPARLEVTPRGETNSYAGAVTFVDNAVNAQAGTILVRGQLPNPDLALWARQFVDVRVFLGTEKDAVMVPEGAVQFGKQGPFLYAVGSGSRAELRPVQTGIRHGDQVQIRSGVAADEKVVVLGQLMLYPGATVVETAPPAALPKAQGGAHP